MIELLKRLASRHDNVRGYINRWILVDLSWLTVRLHEFTGPDPDLFLHDHPWFNVSLILKGGYVEALPASPIPAWQLTPDRGFVEAVNLFPRKPGSVIVRRVLSRHKVWSLLDGSCWTLYISFRRTNAWGFYKPGGKVEAGTYFAASQHSHGKDGVAR
ncbi:MAG: hypothetical protein ACRD0K_17760 [Egibacteraceae bacterium]